MTLSVINVLQILLASQSFLFGWFLLAPGDHERSHRYLAGFLLTLALHMSLNVGREVAGIENISDLSIALGFLYGPWLFLYTRRLAFESQAAAAAPWGHFAPATVILIWALAPGEPPLELLAGLVTASLAAYLFLALDITRRFEKVIQQTRSAGQHLRLRWLRRVLSGMVVIGVLDLLHSVVAASSQAASATFYAGLAFALLIMVDYMIFVGLQQPRLFRGINEEEIQSVTPVSKVIDQPRPDEDSELRLTWERIESVVDARSLAQDPELTLSRLAEVVGAPPRKVSEAINTIGGASFSDFVNKRRVEAACSALLDPERDGATILEILFEVGFNTKSNFYTAFKKTVGTTPTQFRRAAQRSRMAQKSPES